MFVVFGVSWWPMIGFKIEKAFMCELKAVGAVKDYCIDFLVGCL